jgi:phosphatidate cytidylyltransferase
MSAFAARVRTGTTLAVAAAGLLWLDTLFPPGRLAWVVVTGLALVSAWELDRMGSFGARELGPRLYAAALACALLVAMDLFASEHVPASLGLAALYLAAGLVAWPWPGRERLPVAREVVPLALWLLPPLFSVVLIDRDFGPRGLVVLVVLAKIGDNAGYFVGRALGKRHPFPGISPGKTVAGCVASLVAGIVTGAALLPFTLGARTLAGAALGAVVGGLINVAAQAGDLSESWVKRKAGVKDSSALVGPSGGVLDVIDSLLLAAPVALVIWSWVY